MLNKNYSNKKLIRVLNLFDNKFKFMIIYNLLQYPMRFGEIKKNLNSITQQLLTKLLRQLERDELLTRKQYNGFPRKVEYKLTSYGKSFKPIIKILLKWEEKNHKKLNNQIKKKSVNSLYDYF